MGADGGRARQSLVAAQATLADGAPGKEVGHIESDSPILGIKNADQ